MKSSKTTPFICLLLLTILLGSVLFLSKRNATTQTSLSKQVEATPAISAAQTLPPTTEPKSYHLEEDTIFSFLQGPKSQKRGLTWSGSWANLILDGNAFGNFGCGLCCLANVYSSLSEYQCSPVDMYHCAKEVSSYSPSYGIGAIDWPAMKDTLSYCGITSELYNKPAEYCNFQDLMEQSYAAIVLISSQNSTELWKDTPGHYVTIWNYDKDNDTVFLTDSGSPKRNRSQVSLEVVYNSLKTASSYQILSITQYDTDENRWQWNQISEEWVAP